MSIPYESFKGINDLNHHFTKLADLLLNQSILYINSIPHRLIEIEFYFSTPNSYGGFVHDDPYTHSSEVQFTTGNWYFHKTGNVYRDGTWKGLDISIGRGKDFPGGILIRSIQMIDSKREKKFICGPCLCVDHILSLCSAKSPKEMVVEKLKNSLNVDCCIVEKESPNSSNTSQLLYLKYIGSKEGSEIHGLSEYIKEQIKSSGRVGLNMTKTRVSKQKQKEYLFKNYRFYLGPLIKKIFKSQHYFILSELSRLISLNYDLNSLSTKEKEQINNQIYLNLKLGLPQIKKVVNWAWSGFEKEIERVPNEIGWDSKIGDEFIGVRMNEEECCRCFGSLLKNLTLKDNSNNQNYTKQESS